MRVNSRACLGITAALATYGADVTAGVICTGNCAVDPGIQVGSFDLGDGSLTVTAPDQVIAEGNVLIGAQGNDTAQVTVSGDGAEVSTGAEGTVLFLGTNGGTADVTVDDGALIAARANDDDTNQTLALIGDGGTGTVNVENGGIFLVDDPARSGADDGIIIGASRLDGGAGDGTLNVSGSGSEVQVNGNIAYIDVGVSNVSFTSDDPAVGSLNVTDGGLVQIDAVGGALALLSIGRGGESDGSVLVSGSGSTIDIVGPTALLTVADDFTGATGTTGQGSLTITNDAVVNVEGQTPGSSFVIVGFGLGNGQALVDDGGVLNISNQGQLLISANTLDDPGTASENDSQSGVMRINGTGVVNAASTVVGNGTSEDINGILAGTGTLNSDVSIQTGGLLDPGLSPGTFTIGGALTFDGGSLRIEIGGTGPGDYDVVIADSVDFSTALIEFDFIDGFLPSEEDIFEFVSADLIAGLSQATIAFSGVADGFEYGFDSFSGSLALVALNDGVAVPEPGTLGMMSAGLALVALRVRRRTLKTG